MPARIPEEHSETAYSTNRAIEFMDQAGDAPWCLHLSYIKPHWPIVAPAPYHNMYSAADVIPPVRSEAEREKAHPVHAINAEVRYSTAYKREDHRAQVIATYMGLITQIDDHIGRLMAWMEKSGKLDDTLIIFTSDHGDYLGDHWMGEKLFFHDASVKVPLIVIDPSAEADANRGSVDARLTEAIDLVPTIVDFMGGEMQSHILEGRSLMPLLHGQDVDWRDCAFSEADYSRTAARTKLGQPMSNCRMVMAFDGRWKYVYCPGQRPILFDLDTDPQELTDLGTDPAFEAQRARMQARVMEWAYGTSARITQTEAFIEERKPEIKRGILVGFWDETEVAAAFARLDAS